MTQIDASHFDRETAYISVSRQRLDDLRPYVYRTHDGGATWQLISAGIPQTEPVNTVREDPKRRGLLFAGTEKTVYVSFDDGAHWQSLQNDLPSTSIRDLVVHGDDLVVGTHGRSFWILDDIEPLRQAGSETASAPAHLFAPAVAYRVRRDTYTDTPLPPEEPVGENPPDGAIFDYTLARDASGPVTLRSTTRTDDWCARNRAPTHPIRSIPRSTCPPIGSARHACPKRARARTASCGICTKRLRKRSNTVIRSRRSSTIRLARPKASSYLPAGTEFA